MAILQRLGAFRKKFVTHIIDDGETKQEFRFYAPRFLSIATGETRELVEPIVQAITTLMSGGNGETANTYYNSETGAPEQHSRMAGDRETIQALDARRQNAVSQAVGVLFNPMTSKSIGYLLADSMRDEFPSKSEPEFEGIVTKFMEEVTTDILLQMLWGYFKALVPLMDKQGNSVHSGLLEKAKALLSGGNVQAGEMLKAEVEKQSAEACVDPEKVEEEVGKILDGPKPTSSTTAP